MILSQWRIECEEEELALPLRQGFLLRRLLRHLLRQGYEGQEGYSGQDGGLDEGQVRRKKVERAQATLKLRRASGRSAYSISGNSQAIPEMFLAQDQVAGYLLKVIVEP